MTRFHCKTNTKEIQENTIIGIQAHLANKQTCKQLSLHNCQTPVDSQDKNDFIFQKVVKILVYIFSLYFVMFCSGCPDRYLMLRSSYILPHAHY